VVLLCGTRTGTAVSWRLCLAARNCNTRTVLQYLPAVGRNRTMRHNARQHLEEQLRRLEQQQDETRQKLRALARQTRQEQRYRYGELVDRGACPPRLWDSPWGSM
jgi:hypothetical protein